MPDPVLVNILGGIAGGVVSGIISIIPGIASQSGASEDAIARELMEIQREIEAQNRQWDDERKALFEIIGELGKRVNQLANPPVPLWAMNKHYNVGDVVVYQDRKFQCIQAHDSHAFNWTPVLAPALWQGV
jgi:hypothetical protein